MKNRNLYSLILGIAFLVSCGSSDSEDAFDGVPSGEIVDVELRNETLTGFTTTSSGRSQTSGQKWWTHVITKIQWTEACEEDDIQEENAGYYAFKPDGGIYLKRTIDGAEEQRATWEWANANKDAINVTQAGQTVEFTLRSLNNNEVVYASAQTAGPCTLTTWEQFNNPVVE